MTNATSCVIDRPVGRISDNERSAISPPISLLPDAHSFFCPFAAVVGGSHLVKIFSGVRGCGRMHVDSAVGRIPDAG